MNEQLVEWVLLKEPEYLQTKLGFELMRQLGSELTIENCRIDLVFETRAGDILVIELETGIDSESKYKHCAEQMLKLKRIEQNLNVKLRAIYGRNTWKHVHIILLYAADASKPDYVQRLLKLSKDTHFLLKPYLIKEIQNLYCVSLDKLKRTHGVSIGKAVALGVSSLHWLNKFMIHFQLHSADKMRVSDLKSKFLSATNFYVLKRLAEDFDLITVNTRSKHDDLCLTDYGKRFCNGMNTVNLTPDAEPLKLSVEQKRVLIESLLNGNFTKSKVNIFYFLRYVHITEGAMIPKMGATMAPEELTYINNVLKSSYNERTLKELIRQTCNYCVELGFMHRYNNLGSQYDHVVLTPLGSRVLGFIELYLHLKREQYQIPLQI
jgi:hypothetical protein